MPSVRGLSVCLGLCLATVLGCSQAPPADGPRQKVLLVGVDAATWHLARPMMERGELPAFKALCDRGVCGDLISMDPMVSPALWTTIATGVTPKKHGIEGFLEDDPTVGKMVPASSNLRTHEALWTITSQRQRVTNVVGWYASWPAETIVGNLVTDHFLPKAASAFWPVTPEEEEQLGGRTYPRELLQELVPLVPTLKDVAVQDKLLLNFNPTGVPEDEKAAKIFEPHRVDETRFRVIMHLMQKGPWDLSMVFLWGIDPMSHLFWRYLEPETWKGEPAPPNLLALNRDHITNYYKKIDGYLGRLVEQAGPEAVVMIVSDHGFGPASGLTAEGLPLSGDHRKEGVLIAAGGPIRKGVRFDGASILDVTPTILYLMGLPVGEDMDGKVIQPLFNDPLPRPITTVRSWEPTFARSKGKPIESPIDDDIRKQLKALGYMQ